MRFKLHKSLNRIAVGGKVERKEEDSDMRLLCGIKYESNAI